MHRTALAGALMAGWTASLTGAQEPAAIETPAEIIWRFDAGG